MRQLTRKGELERVILTRENGLCAKLVASVAKSLARSSQLEEVKNTVFGSKPFIVSDILDTIVRGKGITDGDVISALTWCLQVNNQVLRTQLG